MFRVLALSVFFILVSIVSFAQDVVGVHEITKGAEPNQYIVKTTVSGLKGVDIARATYQINDEHTYKKLTSNELFSSRNKDCIKFYLMGIPEVGIVKIELSLILAKNEDYSFPVEFQYSRNDVKKVIQFPKLVFEGDEALALKEPIVDTVQSITGKKSNMEESALAAAMNKNSSISSVKKDSVKSKPTIKEEMTDTQMEYTIQLLSLSKFSQARFDDFCDEHSLLPEEVSTRVVNGMTKVIYGKVNSLEEAKKLIDRLKLLNNIDGAFAVPL